MVGQFMRQDNVSYVRGLCAKVTTLIEAAFEVLDSAYCEFKDFPLNQAALSQLQQSEKAFAFEDFWAPTWGLTKSDPMFPRPATMPKLLFALCEASVREQCRR